MSSDDECFRAWWASSTAAETNMWYTSIVCLKSTSYGPTPSPASTSLLLPDVQVLPGRTGLKHACVLPIGHSGKCSHNYECLFAKTNVASHLANKSKTAIYSTPGNDGYVFKNRASRLFEAAISAPAEKKIRNKAVKLSAAIPLKDASSPIPLAQAYVDSMTFLWNIVDGADLFDQSHPAFASVSDMLAKNKTHLKKVFSGREIFSAAGKTICVVTGEECRVEDFVGVGRDMRVECRDTDVQLGHVDARRDTALSIRGGNLLPMSRRGNLIMGERNFMEDAWVDELRRIINRFRGSTVPG